jgi:hypothetical protein
MGRYMVEGDLSVEGRPALCVKCTLSGPDQEDLFGGEKERASKMQLGSEMCSSRFRLAEGGHGFFFTS